VQESSSYLERGKKHYLILGSGKSCERAIADASLIDEIVSSQK
jgi:hypothetical protein